VVPNLGLRMFSDHSFMTGLKVERFLGDGSEFEALREFVPGLDHRAIDWKASARHRKLLCQEFRAERNHQVVLAVDGGQLMAEPVGGVPKLDHAINAAILLGWFCGPARPSMPDPGSGAKARSAAFSAPGRRPSG
jgi:uncharacterized protein (DUF58 family)